VSCLISIYVCYVLANTITSVQTVRGTAITKLEELGFECYGNLGKIAARVFAYGLFIAKLCIYLVIIGKNLVYLWPVLPYRAWVLVALVIAIPASFTRKVSAVERFASLGVVTLAVYILCLLTSSVKSSQKDVHADRADNLTEAGSLSTCASALAVMVFGFGPVDVIAVVRRNMKEPEHLNRAIVMSHMAAFVVYFFAGVIGYWGFGDHVRGNAIMSMCDLPGCLGETDWSNGQLITPDRMGAKWIEGYLFAWAIIVNLLVTIPIVLYCLFTSIESMYPHDEPMPPRLNTAMRVAVPITCSSIALCIPFFLQVIQIFATAIAVPLIFFLPVIFSCKWSRLSKVPQSRKTWVLNSITLVIGVFVLCVGLVDATMDLRDKILAEPDEVAIFTNFWK